MRRFCYQTNATKKGSIFRKESLERLSSPERLDQLMQVVSPKSWLPLVALGSIVGVAFIWSIYGSIPITVEGRGVLIYPSNVVPLQSKSAGQIMALNVKVGDVIKKGQVLATIDQAELRKQLQQQRGKLTQLESQDKAVGSLQGRRLEQEERSQQQQRQYLRQRILELEAITPLLKTKGNTSVDQQRQGLQQRLQQAQALTAVFLRRMKIRQELFQKEGAISGDEALKAEQEYLQNLEKIADIQAQLKELDVKETQQEKDYRENLTLVADLQSQLKQLDSQQASVAQQDLENVTARNKEIQEVKREIGSLELQLSDNSQIISQHSGRILEITLTPGQVVNAGTRLATIEAENPQSKLVGVTYFPVAEGKKIQPGMSIQITPQTVKRERFGGIVGNVTSISRFPITKEAAANEVGNSEVLEGLVSQQQGLIQVFSHLELDANTPSGYKWSSSTGPHLNISSGTTTVVRVKVEERAPITFVLPILRSASGIY
ncbi:NHLP bacteriocin system secretion protein [Anabaena sp. FACHB-709]|uniref:NHLP bacteriocin system secretion protein n=1 Tax=Anabaena cylindrica FACHB-318 TaxID=2692880 RepID=A0ABR7ZNI7_ANACY|nr:MULTISPECIES: NHLP bacteriocin system secretion protein [Nostocaceae]HBW33040.1 NHLP bacteriocin system secretion protein [Nostoc sp. UBA8866]MBD2173930.1 NHLP bacteriocin system secretion protein [Anabaena cylindrica FACHB-318]MBD2265678.1 NHLP bacteriocin system secretion protein [Anabaena sp. FACHB-709]MBD2275035.1 NHLP bacteriocin system secretion protein [Nostoc sp. PCC 7120 = FACHB-418]MBD2286028.1 NHLP bacteriocin system secretion protein [Anabaena cylindrica FACHB-170]